MPDEIRKRAVLIVTGASRGIGAATARLAAARGYDVAINYRRDAAAAEAVAAAIRTAGGVAETFQADVSDDRAVADMFALIERRLGRPGVLVNNAGISGGVGAFAAIPPATCGRSSPPICSALSIAVRRLPGGCRSRKAAPAARSSTYRPRPANLAAISSVLMPLAKRPERVHARPRPRACRRGHQGQRGEPWRDRHRHPCRCRTAAARSRPRQHPHAARRPA